MPVALDPRMKEILAHSEKAGVSASQAGWYLGRLSDAIRAGRWKEAEACYRAAYLAMQDAVQHFACDPPLLLAQAS